MTDGADNPVDEFEPRFALGEAVSTAAPCTLRWAVEAGGPLARACRARPEKLDGDALEIRCGGSDGRALAALAERAGRVLATIRRGELDLMFVVPVLDVVERGMPCSYVARLELPKQLLVSARRGLFRVEISPADFDISARVWQ